MYFTGEQKQDKKIVVCELSGQGSTEASSFVE